MKEENKSLTFKNVSLNNKILDLRAKLHQSEKMEEVKRVEIIKLKAEFDELKEKPFIKEGNNHFEVLICYLSPVFR